MANTENIEAKLCAFVDGELDEAGRAEIEQHLIANPQHRSLLQELMQQRSLLRELPRAKAPEDLLESVQNQMERTGLLDDVGGQAQVAGRINRWPQVWATAAVLLLAIGLVAVITFVLPNQSKPQNDFALLTSKPASQPAAPITPAPSTPDGRVDEKVMTKGGAGGEIFSKRSTDDALLQKAGAGSLEYQDIFADKDVADKVSQVSGVSNKSMLVIVSSDDTSGANRQVQKYLESNGIHWENAPEAMPVPLEQSQVVSGSRLQNNIQRIPLKNGAPQRAEDNSAGQLGQSVDESKQQLGQQQQIATAAPSPGAAAAPETPVADASTKELDRSTPQQSLAMKAKVFDQQSPASTAPAPAAEPSYIVARGLTRAQVLALNSNITSNADGRARVSNFYRAGNNLTPASIEAPAATELTKSPTLLPQSQSPSTQSANVVLDATKQADVAIAAVPQAAQFGADSFQRRIGAGDTAGAAREKLEAVSKSTTDTAARLRDVATTRPFETLSGGAIAPAAGSVATAPATTTSSAAVVLTAPTTAPSTTTTFSGATPATTTASAESELLDVVIVVQSEVAQPNEAATAPATTQAKEAPPASAPAATTPATSPASQ